jgi:hypothetical protein
VLEFLADRAGHLEDIHLELAPKPLGSRLREALCRFRPGVLHIEVGIQTYDPEVSRTVQRPFDPEETDRMIRFLLDTAKAAVHADLIAGLPGETPEGFARGFDRLLALGPGEIQLGLLKRLHGAPITELAAPWNMRYNEHPPYDVISTAHMDASTIQRLKIMARYWDMLHNRGRYPRTLAMITNTHPSPFQAFLRLSDWLHNRLQATHAIPMLTMMRALLDYLTGPLECPPGTAAQALLDDYETVPGHIKPPRFAKDLIRKR